VGSCPIAGVRIQTRPRLDPPCPDERLAGLRGLVERGRGALMGFLGRFVSLPYEAVPILLHVSGTLVRNPVDRAMEGESLLLEPPKLLLERRCCLLRPRSATATSLPLGEALKVVLGRHLKATAGSRFGRGSASRSRRSSTAGRHRTPCRSTGCPTSAPSRRSRAISTSPRAPQVGALERDGGRDGPRRPPPRSREPVGQGVRQHPPQAARGRLDLPQRERPRRHTPPAQPAVTAPRVAPRARSRRGEGARAERREGGRPPRRGRELHVVSAVCTHLGCLVDWNGADRTCDCPCHGSRFDPGRRVRQGPAVKDLPARAVL
jgi:hypothetical protein